MFSFFSFFFFFSSLLTKIPYTQCINLRFDRGKKIMWNENSRRRVFSSFLLLLVIAFFSVLSFVSRTLNPFRENTFRARGRGGMGRCTVDEARTMRCRKLERSFFTPKSIGWVFGVRFLWKCIKTPYLMPKPLFRPLSLSTNIIFIEWMNELKFFLVVLRLLLWGFVPSFSILFFCLSIPCFYIFRVAWDSYGF